MYTYKDFKKYDEDRKGEPALLWLPEFEAWLSERYGVSFLPCYYKEIHLENPTTVLYNITPVVMSEQDSKTVYTKTIKGPLIEGAEYELDVMRNKCIELASKYNVPELNPNDLMRVFHCEEYLSLYRDYYLFGHLAFNLSDEISSFFKPYNPIYTSSEIPAVCVLNTKEEARDFLLSEDIKKIKKQIYDLLKSYDEYDVLTEDDIDIFVDYKEHKAGISMYGRWISDMNKEDMENYKNKIING